MQRSLPWPSCFFCEAPDLVEYLVLEAWFEHPYYRQKAGETLRAELCRACVRQHLEPWVRFLVTRPEPPRSPYVPPLTFNELRKQARVVKDIGCHSCNQTCSSQYMRLSSATTRLAQHSWLTVGQQQQIHEHVWKAELCPACVQQRLESWISFVHC